MDENVRKLRVGIFVLMAIVILGILILLHSEGLESQYTVYAKAKRAPGVTIGTPARKNGILIGRVKNVATSDEQGLVILTLGINVKDRIYENETCSIRSEFPLGDAVVEFLPLGLAERGDRVEDGDTIGLDNVEIARDPLEIVTSFGDLKPQVESALQTLQDAGASIQNAGASVKTTSDDVSALSRRVQSVLEEDGQLNQLVQEIRISNRKAQLAIDEFNSMFGNINEYLDDPERKKRFGEALAEMPKIFQEVRLMIADTRTAINKFGSIPDDLNPTISNIRDFSDSLKNEGPEILTRVNSNLKSLEQFVGELKGVGKTLEKFKNADGTIIKLLEDDGLYQQIREVVENINDVSVRLGPLMDDARIFADGIARDPGQLGVRGALNRRAPNTGYKGSAGLE